MTASLLHIGLIDPWVIQPETAAAHRTFVLARAFAHAGHRVTVLAGATAPADDHPDALPTLRILRHLPALTRKFGHGEAPMVGAGHGLRLFLALCAQTGLDIIVVRNAPWANLWPCALYGFLTGVPIVVDAPDVPTPGARGGALSRWILRRAVKHVFCAAPEIKSWFETLGVAPALMSIAPNGCDTALFGPRRDASPAPARLPQLRHGPWVIYAGQLHRGRRVSEILDLAAVMRTLAPEVRFAILGDGPDRLDLNAYAARLDVLERSVWFLPLASRAELAEILAAATAVFALPTSAGDAHRDAGTHVFDGLAAGKPIAVLGDGWQRDLIEGRQAGVILPAGNAEAAARELADFLGAGDLVRRAAEQASALANGKHNAERIAAETRHTVEKLAATHARGSVLRRRSMAMKRLLDVAVALVGVVVLAPLMIAIAAITALAGWAPLARRARSGRRGKTFQLLAFDTLPREHPRTPDVSAPWGERWARFLRHSALDRLPELINVLAGDMSLVGPRPLPAEYANFYSDEHRRRLEVRPGLTGWAQVEGRGGFTWDQMFAHDVWYVDHLGVGLDVKILLRTLGGLLMGRGLSKLPTGQLARFDEIEARRQGAEDV